MVDIGSKTSRSIVDYKLSRYACYLIVQNSDPRKEVVALGQTYFAIQTRKQELTEKNYNELSEDEKRFYQRDLTRKIVELKILINFIMLDTKDFIMEKLLMIFLKEKIKV